MEITTKTYRDYKDLNKPLFDNNVKKIRQQIVKNILHPFLESANKQGLEYKEAFCQILYTFLNI